MYMSENCKNSYNIGIIILLVVCILVLGIFGYYNSCDVSCSKNILTQSNELTENQSMEPTVSEQAPTVSEQAPTVSEQAPTVSEQAPTVSEVATTVYSSTNQTVYASIEPTVSLQTPIQMQTQTTVQTTVPKPKPRPKIIPQIVNFFK
jgi:hypothetical protein